MHMACCNQRENGTNSFSGESKCLLQSGAKGEMPRCILHTPYLTSEFSISHISGTPSLCCREGTPDGS